MTNAEKFKEVFGVYATETWAMPESDFLSWLNGEYNGEERTATWSEVIAVNVEHNGVIRHFCCSYCGRVVSVLYPQELGLLYPYCHCGAKMEVEE